MAQAVITNGKAAERLALLRGDTSSSDAEARLIEGINERIALCRGTAFANCIGTALYLIGQEKVEACIDSNDAYDNYLSKLERLKSPVAGCLVAWVYDCKELIPDTKISRLDMNSRDYLKKRTVAHLGVVASLNPMLIANRERVSGRFFPDQAYEELEKNYKFCRVGFYRPEILVVNLEKVINTGT
jgi:hypothetical protein